MRRLLAAVAAVVSGASVAAASVVAAPVILGPGAGREVRMEAYADPGRGTIALIPLDDQERTLVAIAATFDASKYCDATSVIVTARINGIAIEPPFPAFIGERSAEGCTATGIFRIDLDAAELVHPGAFIGQPLNVTLTYWG